MTLSKTHSPKDIYDYREKALEELCDDHPHYDEIADIIDEQVREDFTDYVNSFPVSDT